MIITKTLLLALAALLFAIPARAEEGTCGDVDITLKKNAVHDQTLTVSGRFHVWSPDGKPLKAFDLKWVGKDGVIFNGKRCELNKE